MKILRTSGQSFTQVDNIYDKNGKKRIGRGIVVRYSRSFLAKPDGEHGRTVLPELLPTWIADDPDLLVRQIASVFNKVIRTKSRLRYFCLEAYSDRVLLGNAVWSQLARPLGERLASTEAGRDKIEKLQTLWLALIHPYASYPIPAGARDLKKDKNAEIVRDFGEKAIARSEFNGRWHKVFWVIHENGCPDYEAVAMKILLHLIQQEVRISGKPRTSKKEKTETGVGLIKSRAASIQISTHDPRGDAGKGLVSIPERLIEFYFYADIAKEISERIENAPKESKFWNSSDFGKIIYEFFGTNPRKDEFKNFKKEDRDLVWNLHNMVRSFYTKLAESERFRRAFANRSLGALDGNSSEWLKLTTMVPRNKEALLAVIKVKDRNADFSRLVRLGKVLAHACDIDLGSNHDPAIDEKFRARLDYLVTSSGQSEIKRNEGFTRIWRNAVGLSVRSMGAWANVDRIAENDQRIEANGEDFDLTLAENSKRLAQGVRADEFAEGVRRLFGDKAHGQLGGVSRAKVFLADTIEERREILWGYLRLCSEIRNGTNHFNTKRRIIDLVRNCAVRTPDGGQQPQPIGGRKNYEISQAAASSFSRLLEFDQKLERVVIADELNRIGASRFVPDSAMEKFIIEIAVLAGDQEIAAPKFMSVLQKAKNLAEQSSDGVPEQLRSFAILDLKNLSSRPDDVTQFRVGALRLLYERGFVHWLRGHLDDTNLLADLTRALISGKEKRKAQYDKEHGRVFGTDLQIGANIDLAAITSLSDLIRTLAVEAMSDDSLARRSRAASRNRFEKKLLIAEQKKRSGSVEEFRRELFAALFGEYLRTEGMAWILLPELIGDPSENREPLAIDVLPERPWVHEDWHSQFYAWLYLVPLDDISLLQSQFRRLSVLESRTSEEASAKDIATLKELDRLMGLYIAVQAAGFGGLEHQIWLKRSKEGNFENPFYEKDEQFDLVFSQENETHHMSIPGTRRGLRQIIRFRELEALRPIFMKHRVTESEVLAFTASEKLKPMRDTLEEKNALREKIIEVLELKDRKPLLKSLCAKYKACATIIARHNFELNGARLTDFARVYQLLMRVIGRLNDFTLTWERDRLFVYLGMLYDAVGMDAFRLARLEGQIGGDRRTWVGVALPKFDASETLLVLPKSSEMEMVGGLIGQHHFLPIWDSRVGIVLKGYAQELALLPDEQRGQFSRYFGVLADENPKDAEARRRSKAVQGQKKQSRFSWECPKAWIRNSFAHYNVIGAQTKVIKLSYHINAVRSLFGYDRKTKNAVSRAVIDILRDEGLDIRWALDRDRLRDARILPLVRTELGFVGLVDGQDLSFDLPQVSVRFTSMVQALFGFESGGHRSLVVRGGETKSRGKLAYPADFVTRQGDRIPSEVLIEYPEI